MANDNKFENSVHIAGFAGGSPELQEFSSRDWHRYAVAIRQVQIADGKGSFFGRSSHGKMAVLGKQRSYGGAGTEYGAWLVMSMSRNTTRSTEGKSGSNWLIESLQ